MKIIFIFILYKFKLKNTGPAVELPFFGHICLYVHKGYKIFDLGNRTVIKTFDSDVDRDSIVIELERLKNVTEIDFAPTLRQWNIDKKWYEEEYISESPPAYFKSLDSTILIEKISSEIIPCLNRLVSFKQPKAVNLLDYAKKIYDISGCNKFLGEKGGVKEIAGINSFLNLIFERLQSGRHSPLYLVFSHGDFCPANILQTKDGIKIIDWESAGYRSALFDFYSYFFYLPVCNKFAVDRMEPESGKALSEFISQLTARYSDMSGNISESAQAYRSIFYIEYICKLVERQLTDKNLNIMDFITKYIGAFERFEEIIADN